MILMIFTLKTGRADGVDHLFRKGLGGLQMAPSTPLPRDIVRQAAATSPNSAGISIAAHKTALAITAAAGVAGGACVWQIAHTNPTQTVPPTPSPTAETCSDSTQAIVPATDTISVKNESRNICHPKPITVTQEVEVRKTVIVRDTDFVKDTIYLFGKP